MALAGLALLGAGGVACCVALGQNGEAPAAQAPATEAPATSPGGGTIRGTVKAGAVPLPGVAITATNTLTGKKYATATDVDGKYAMAIPRTGRYVVRAELAAFAPATSEVRITAEVTEQTAEFGMQLASRVAAAQAQSATASATRAATALGAGTLALNMSGDEGAMDASAGGGNNGAALPSAANLGDSSAAANDAVAVNGAQGTTNPLANMSEDQIRERVEDAMAQARAQGGAQGDQMNAVVGMLGNIVGGGPGGGGGFGGGGGRGGRGGGGGAFRNFNPAQPHGAVFYQGGNNALNSAPWSPTLEPIVNPAAYSNRFGVSLAGSPYIPGLTRANTKQFAFLNFTGQKNLNAFLPNPVRVPTALERTGDFSQSFQKLNGAVVPVTLYDPQTGLPIPGNNLANATTPLSTVAQNILKLNYYPLPNIATSDPTGYNYQTVSNAGANNVAINARFVRQLGQGAGGGFGPGGFGGGGGRRGGNNAPPVLRQNINVAYNYAHAASDQRNIFLPLGGATESDGNGLNLGYTISYGRVSNNASVNWNRSHAETRNYFTDTANNPTAQVGISVPNQAGGFADPRFYNGLASLNITNFSGLSNATPSETTNQTISFSDFVAWRHKKHNMRFGLDIRRVHYDAIGGNNPLGSYTFSGYATSAPADQVAGQGGINSGSGFADFLLGLPESTSIQAGLFKDYLRENVYDGYAQDDFRALSNLTLNYGLRYEYFAPYTEKNNHLVNLTHNASFTQIGTVMPGSGGYPTSLIYPDRTMFAPRFGFAWRPKIAPKLTKELVVRGGYGINYNTGQYSQFARSLSHQAPFAVTQNNAAPIPTQANPTPAATGCTTTQAAYTYVANGALVTRPATTANLRLANGFGCSTALAITNNYAVDPNYRLGMVQVYNLNLQRTFGLGIVVNVGYNGSKGSNLDVVGSPNATPAGTTTAGVAPFDYEESLAASHSNQLVVSVQKRQQKGIAVGATYVYSHSIDNASGVGGAAGTPIQNFYRLDLENGNSSFDQRHNLSGNWVLELPFGPNREFLNKGGVMAKVLDGFSLSGTFTFATGSWLTPQYTGSTSEAAGANTFTLRPNRVAGQAIRGAGSLKSYFNTAAFTAPAAGQYGTASPGSIEGPGTVQVNTSLSRTASLGGTRSFEARVTATNVFNTVQYSGVNVQVNSANYGQVTSAAAMRALQVQARYRF